MALPKVGTDFGVFRNFVKNCVNHFIMILSECLGLVKHIYSIQAIILISLIRLQGVSKYEFLLVTSIRYLHHFPL